MKRTLDYMVTFEVSNITDIPKQMDKSVHYIGALNRDDAFDHADIIRTRLLQEYKFVLSPSVIRLKKKNAPVSAIAKQVGDFLFK